LRSNDRAVADNHGQRRADLERNRQSKIVTPAGYQSDLDSTTGGRRDCGAIGIWELPMAVQKRPVNIEGD
jgi:hypothetical protein